MKRSIRLLGLAVVILGLGFGVTANFYQDHLETVDDERERARNALQQAGDLIAERTAEAVVTRDLAAIHRELEFLATVPIIQTVQIYDFAGNPLLEVQKTGRELSFSEASDSQLQSPQSGFHAQFPGLTHVTPIHLDRATIGWVEAAANRELTESRVSSSFWRFLLESFLVWCLLGLLVVIIFLQARFQHRLERRLRIDEVTGELSRHGFKQRCGNGQRQESGVLFLLDLKNLKSINDGHGITTGDRVLWKVAAALRAYVGPHADIARLSADDFAIVAPCSDWTSAEQLAGELIDAVRSADLSDIRDIGRIRAHAGISLIGPEDDLSQRLSEADMALCQAKQTSPSGFMRADDAFLDASRERGETVTERDIRRGLKQGEFAYFIQPLMDTYVNEIVGYEALIRWRVDGETLSPAVFLDRFKEAIKDPELYQCVVAMRRELSQRAARNGVGLLAYNIRLEDLPRLATSERFLNDFGADAGNGLQIMIEVSESGLPRSLGDDLSDLKSAWTRIHDERSVLALDDFGALESNLYRLRELDIDYVKIDKALISTVEADPKAQAIVRSIATLCRDLHIAVIAEGIEREAQARIIRTLGITLQQGFYHGRPQPADHYLNP
ncbi:EAL domain-containing protein [Spiribacter insolitus]|uniref:EAL domain-containing protein n=1 Tax=Spiribacter insolitus TaxID=3122417 RepID=A0ABV3T603_9GAMM